MINLCGLRLSADSWKLIGAAFAKAVYVRSFVVSHCNLHKLALESLTPHIGKNVTLETIDWSSNDIDDTYSGIVALIFNCPRVHCEDPTVADRETRSHSVAQRATR